MSSMSMKPSSSKKLSIKRKPIEEEEEEKEEDPPKNKKQKTTSSSSNVANTYKKLQPIEHILHRPDMYVGDITRDAKSYRWVYSSTEHKMKWAKISIVPALFKIFDEILVNASDHKQRHNTMKELRVDIDQKTGILSVFNDGPGIPVEKHAEYGIYVPTFLFGDLFTSSNFDDTEKKTTGGRNGVGAKCTNVYSKMFQVETSHTKSGKMFSQIFRNNMQAEPAIITKRPAGQADFTRITFLPDYKRFGMDEDEGLDDDMYSLLCKRVVDMAGCHGKSLNIYLNHKKIKIDSFKDYAELYTIQSHPSNGEEEEETDKAVQLREEEEEEEDNNNTFKQLYVKIGERWEIIVAESHGSFQQMSFVNSICTSDGGTHVNYIVEQITKRVVEHIAKKNKNTAVKPQHVRNHLKVFIKSTIDNPVFTGQTKTQLASKRTAFGSTCALPEGFLKKIIASNILSKVLYLDVEKQTKDLNKNDGKKRSRITGIAKLDDANNAGGKLSSQCTLILTEGDSAKALAVSGLAEVGRDFYGVFPLKGKLLNVRDASPKQILANTEIGALKQIIGLQQGKVYENTSTLRYGHVMVMTDQDHDGSHIKGLLINLFEYFWPSLLKIAGFLVEFITPIVKVVKGKHSTRFYSIPEYETWKEEHEASMKQYTFKYYKGLGTSSSKEAREYFADLQRHQIDFQYSGKQDRESIDLAFAKKRADDRKTWLGDFEPGTFLDQNVASVSYTDFVNKELILFSMASNLRAIPSIMDGLKPGQRKILYCCFRRNLTHEIKVAQLAGYVSENSAYHHGEAALTQTIVGLAQNFTGSNNIRLLYPSGQFGTRISGGKDAASARYIFTRLSNISRYIFNEKDDAVLLGQKEEGKDIEPVFYVPIIPMVLVNGSSGIGTGWSSNIPNYNPRSVAKNIKRLITNDGDKEKLKPMIPWYHGYNGHIQAANDTKYLTFGSISTVNDTTLLITELPIQKWTNDYKDYLHSLKEHKKIHDFKEYNTEYNVSFLVIMTSEQRAAIADEDLYKFFKLYASITTTNMVLFDVNGKLKRYDNVLDILYDFYLVRLKYYKKRKKYVIKTLELEVRKLANRSRFILGFINDEIELRNVKKTIIVKHLTEQGYDTFDRLNNEEKNHVEKEHDNLDDAGDDDDTKRYNYLLSMPLYSLTRENVHQLLSQKGNKEALLQKVKDTTIENMWISDLDSFLVALDDYDTEESDAIRANNNNGNNNSKKTSAKGKNKTLRLKAPEGVLIDPPDASRINVGVTTQKAQIVSVVDDTDIAIE